MLVHWRILSCLLAIPFAGMTAANAASGTATVTEAVNHVDYGSSQTSATSPAKAGSTLQDGDYLETGAKSRAELEFSNQTITRLGANTIFNYSVASNEVDLQAGTLLFSKPKDSPTMTIKTAAVTAAIVGTTGFIQQHGQSFLFGLVEGHTTLTIGGVDYHIGPGEIAKFTPGSPPQIFYFNVSVFLATCPLITRFHHPLPNQSYIDQEIAEYNDLVSRGFIQPVGNPYFVTSWTDFIPPPPIPAGDSSGTALKQFNTPPPPPPRRIIYNP